MKKIIYLTIFSLLIYFNINAQVAGDYENTRPLNELNSNGISESYPHISGDGLTLYFTRGRIGSSNLYTTSRSSLSSVFSEPVLLASDFPSGSYSCWLTEDELDIYYLVYTNATSTLYTRHRTTKTNSFLSSTINTINTGTLTGFISSPSLTADKTNLYLLVSTPFSSNKGLYMLTQSSTFVYGIPNSFTAPSGYQFGSGRLNVDNQSNARFYLSLRNNGQDYIYFISPANLSSQSSLLSNYTPLQGEIGPNSLNIPKPTVNIQPSLTNDRKTIVFVRNVTEFWEGNDLYIGTLNASSSPRYTDDENFSNATLWIELFPNPSAGNFYLNYGIPINSKNTDLTIYTIEGITIKTIHLSNSSNTIPIDISGMNPGIYICSATSDNGEKVVKKLMINNSKN